MVPQVLKYLHNTNILLHFGFRRQYMHNSFGVNTLTFFCFALYIITYLCLEIELGLAIVSL